MKSILYLDIIGGIAGDMLVGGLLDLGVPFSLLEEELKKLQIPEFEITTKREKRHQVAGTHFIVKQTHPSPAHRAFHDIKILLEKTPLKDGVRERSLKIFETLANAEGHIHQVLPDKVHFHEVGAWDSIADIVGISICLDYLAIHDIYVSPIPTGTGYIKTAHGQMPIPAPATMVLLKGFEIIKDTLPFERTTPTGAATIAALAQSAPPSFQYRINQVGIGIGTKISPDVPNILRCVLGTVSETVERESDIELVQCSESNLDDCSPEYLGYVQEQLFEIGALDVWMTSIQMKKNRPGVLLQVLHIPEKRKCIHDLIFRETTTLGIRYCEWNRVPVKRNIVEISTPWGIIKGKEASLNGHIQFSPEFEDCRKIAKTHKIPLKDIYRIVTEHYWHRPSDGNLH